MELIQSTGSWILIPMARFALGIGVFFTGLTIGVQFRRLPDMIRQLKSSKSGDGDLSSFQTFAPTMSSRMGVGYVAGVTTAIAAGGPGAIMWMAIVGPLGSTCAYAEAVLAQVFTRRILGGDRGGMPYCIKFGLKAPWLAVMIVCRGMGIDAVFGGLIRYEMAWGVRRAVFASATGLGEGTFAAADTTHPAKQGIVRAFSIYIDIRHVDRPDRHCDGLTPRT